MLWGVTVVNTETLYPDMMRKTNMLIVDYNVLRYHSFDWIRYKLLDRSNFDSFDQKYIDLVKYSDDLSKSVWYAKNTIDDPNPLNLFNNIDKSIPFPESLNREIVNLCKSDIQKTHITMTDLSYRIGIIFGRNDIHGYLLKFKSDKDTVYTLPDNVEVYESDNLLNLNVLLRFIKEHNINAIMVDSIDLAASIACKVDHQMTFMIANYRYNYQTLPDGTLITKGLRELSALEYNKKHEFGFFDPFCDLSEYMRRKLHDTNPINGNPEPVPERDDQPDD